MTTYAFEEVVKQLAHAYRNLVDMWADYCGASNFRDEYIINQLREIRLDLEEIESDLSALKSEFRLMNTIKPKEEPDVRKEEKKLPNLAFKDWLHKNSFQ